MPALTLKSRVLGSHLFFFREGDAFTVPEAGTCAAESKPDGNDPAYINIGSCEEAEDDISGGTDLEVWRPSPGALQLKDIVTIKEKMMIKFTTGEITALAIESFYRTSQKLNSLEGQFNPLSGAMRKGWLHVERYDHENDIFVTMDVWGRLKCLGPLQMGGNDFVKPQWEFTVLYSSLNTGLIGE